MKILSPTTTERLLQISLEALHNETVGWLEDIAFWRDEIAFLYTLELKQTLKSVPVSEKNAIQKIESELVRLTGKDIERLDDEAEKHEVELYRLLTTHAGDEAAYREVHDKIKTMVDRMEKRIKVLKVEIFRLVRLNKTNLIMNAAGNREPQHPEVHK